MKIKGKNVPCKQLLDTRYGCDTVLAVRERCFAVDLISISKKQRADVTM